MEQKKLVIKLEVHGDKGKQKAMQAVSSFPGVTSISMDMKENKLTLLGQIDPVKVVDKLRKLGHAEIVTVGPPDKPKEEAKKDDEAKKKEEAEKKKKEDDKKKEEEEKKKAEEKHIAELAKAYQNFNPYLNQHYQIYRVDENPNNDCVIC